MIMKLGFGLYSHMLDDEHFKFAKQCGATHLVVHLVDYFAKSESNQRDNQPIGNKQGWGIAGASREKWNIDYLSELIKRTESYGLKIEAIENFDPIDWYDILLDGPKKMEQISHLKDIIRMIGEVGIPTFGYNFSLAGVSSRIEGEFARGDAVSVGMSKVDEEPIKNGMVWNMVYDKNAGEGTITEIDHEELWKRLTFFLEEIIPVAEEAGVQMAAHPDDPPVPFLKKTPRLVYQPDMYQKLINIQNSQSNKLEFCLGSISEMTEGDIYEATEKYSAQNKIAYIHFRNVQGKVPTYKEVFVDEGDIDMLKILRILKKNNFSGVLIPDHTPKMTCNAPWYAGMAYAMGYIKGLMAHL